MNEQQQHVHTFTSDNVTSVESSRKRRKKCLVASLVLLVIALIVGIVVPIVLTINKKDQSSGNYTP